MLFQGIQHIVLQDAVVFTLIGDLDNPVLFEKGIPVDKAENNRITVNFPWPSCRICRYIVQTHRNQLTQQCRFTTGMAELGIDDAVLQAQFPYTRILAQDADGQQRGISWQACPGVMIYRRDIARKVLGTDDPRQVQQQVADWQRFSRTASRMKAGGFHMLAGYYDTYRVFASGVSAPWVNEQQEIVLDPAMEQWREQTIEFTRAGWSYPNNLWDSDWKDQVKGDVFCYFGPAWLLEHALQELSQGDEGEGAAGTFGQWAVCRGPQPYFWGGSWICAARGTDNAAVIADIMPITSYRNQKRGGRGVTGMGTKEADFVENMLITTTHHTILFFTNRGRVYHLKAYEIAESSRQAKGTAIINLLPIENDEKITAVIPIKHFKPERFLFMELLLQFFQITLFESRIPGALGRTIDGIE